MWRGRGTIQLVPLNSCQVFQVGLQNVALQQKAGKLPFPDNLYQARGFQLFDMV